MTEIGNVFIYFCLNCIQKNCEFNFLLLHNIVHIVIAI